MVLGAVACATVAVLLARDHMESRGQRLKKAAREKLERRMLVPFREQGWREEDLKEFNGDDQNKPILLAASGIVFNVWRSRELYGKDGVYHALAGRDSTRMLAKMLLEDESEEERKEDLTSWEQSQLEDWIHTFDAKYDCVGRLHKS